MTVRASFIFKYWHRLYNSPKAAWDDQRAIGWRWLLFGLAATLWIILLATGLTMLAILGPRPGGVEDCLLGHNFSLFQSRGNFWDINGFFQISLAMGQLTFTAAKILIHLQTFLNRSRD